MFSASHFWFQMSVCVCVREGDKEERERSPSLFFLMMYKQNK